MIEITRITRPETPGYPFIEKLLTEAFPKEERRDLPEFRSLTMYEERFHNLLITDDDVPVGFITHWDLGRFCYIEHFAIDPAMRNGGYGSRVLELMRHRLRLPIVLEAEPPTDEMARRRIAFYQRQGFTRWQSHYLQPPYRPGDPFLPLTLMVHGDLHEPTDFPHISQTIHHVVYGVR